MADFLFLGLERSFFVLLAVSNLQGLLIVSSEGDWVCSDSNRGNTGGDGRTGRNKVRDLYKHQCTNAYLDVLTF